MVSGMNFTHHISRGFRDIGGYTPSITHTMAHELGLGLFGLDHIFSGAYGIKKGTTYNLMDYTEKTPNDALSYHEWTQINRPLPNWSALSRAEEDMNRKGKERQEKAWETAWQIYEEEKLKGRNIVYYTLRNTLKTVNENDGLGTRKEDLSLNYISGQILFQNNLIQDIWFDNYHHNRIVDSTLEYIQSSSLNKFESEQELGDFILYEAGDGSIQFCEIPLVSLAGIDKKGEALSNHVKENWQNCVAPTSTEQEDEQQIKSTLNALAQQFRSTQYVEYSANGIAYRLNKNGELEKSTLSNEDINKGLFSGVDEIYRFEKNGNGIFQLSAYGINQSLTNVQGKAVDKEALAKYIKELANEFFVENKVSSPEQKPTQSLDSDAFPDGDKVKIDKKAFFTEIISEAGGIGITFLKTSEVEPQVYYKDANKLTGEIRTDPIIHAPAVVTGVTEGVGQELTDITSMCSMIYGVIVDKEERQKTIDGFVALKDQVADDPKTLFPLLGDVVLASVTSSTSGDFKEMMDENTDDGRSGHLKTRTATGTTITVVETAVGGGATMLPSISKKLAQKIRLQKWLKKINLPDGVDTKPFTQALDNLEDGGEAFLKDFENASSEVIERFVKNPDLVDAWKILSDIKSDLRKNVNKLEDLGSVIKKNNLKVGKNANVGKDAIADFIKNNKWDDVDGVITAMKRASDYNIEGLVFKYKKFPVSKTGSSWVLDNAKKYQGTSIRNADGKLISGSGDANLSFEYNGTSFDNVIDGKLIDNKFGHGNSVFKESDDMFSEFINEANDLDNITIKNQKRADAILEQAKRQIQAVGGNVEIEWHVSTQLGAKGIQKLFRDEGINIKVKWIKQQ